MKYSDMYPIMNKAKQWEVVRVLGDHKFVTPWSYPTKEMAIKFCKENGFCKDGVIGRR